MEKDYDALLIIASSEINSDLYYATKFLAPDPFMFLQQGEQKALIIGDLELDRAKKQAKTNLIISLSHYENIAKQKGIEKPLPLDGLDEILKEKGIKKILVPASFPIEAADILRQKGYIIKSKKDPFYEERTIKSKEEIESIVQVLRLTERALDVAVQTISNSEIEGDFLLFNGEVLTSESVKKIINLKLMEDECIAHHTIVSCGMDSCDPHYEGSGPLRPHQPIIIDIFPRSIRTRYYADITRTVVKGEATEPLKKMYQAVLKGQEMAFNLIKDGVDGAKVHQAVEEFFYNEGYESGEKGGRRQGFFHGTGHGLGLDIHEPPTMGKIGHTLKRGNVVTVEPGLYYAGIGGVRIEDIVLVTENGCEILTTYPKFLEL